MEAITHLAFYTGWPNGVGADPDRQGSLQ
ncbi:hypothetical protein [Pseudoduganella umbonata]